MNRVAQATRTVLATQYRAGITQLAPRLIHHHRHRIRQVHAAAVRHHRNTNFLLGWQGIQNGGRQAAGFRTKHQIIPVLIAYGAVRWRAFGGQGEHALWFFGSQKRGVIVMTNDGEQSHEFEVLDPKGETVGEIGETEPGKRGEATITFAKPGTYTYQCILEDAATHKEHSAFGMKGRFTVS